MDAIKPKVGKNDLGCAVLAAVVILAVVSLVLVLVAKSGLLRIPLFSNLYHGPVPTREVSAPPMTADEFQALLASRIQAEAIAHAPPYRVQVSEAELSAALEQAIPLAVRGGGWVEDRAQVVIIPQGLELLGEFHRGILHADFLIQLAPHVNDGKLSFEPTSIHMGDYALPPAVAAAVVSEVFSRDLGSWSIDFGELQLENLELHDGSLDIVTGALNPSP